MLQMSAVFFPASLAAKVWAQDLESLVRCSHTFDLEAAARRSEAGSSGHIQFPVAPILVATPHPMGEMWGV